MIRKVEGFTGFTGYIVIDLGKYRQRMAEISSLSLSIAADGKVELANSSAMAEAMKLYDIVHKRVTEVNLTHKKTKQVFTSIDELEDYQEYGAIMAKLIELFNNGEALGN